MDFSFIKIDNSRIIARLLPYWLRGKKVFLFLKAILHPLVPVHTSFIEWAKDKYIKAHITSQKQSLEWYLNYRLKNHFANVTLSFEILYDTCSIENVIFTESEKDLRREHTAPIYFNDEESKVGEMILRQKGEVKEATVTGNIYAPAITPTSNYSTEDYRREITSIVNQFITNFKKYNVIIE